MCQMAQTIVSVWTKTVCACAFYKIHEYVFQITKIHWFDKLLIRYNWHNLKLYEYIFFELVKKKKTERTNTKNQKLLNKIKN